MNIFVRFWNWLWTPEKGSIEDFGEYVKWSEATHSWSSSDDPSCKIIDVEQLHVEKHLRKFSRPAIRLR